MHVLVFNLFCWLEEQIVNLSGRLFSSTETLAKEAGLVVNSEDSLKENTEMLSANVSATFMSTTHFNKYIFALRRLL